MKVKVPHRMPSCCERPHLTGRGLSLDFPDSDAVRASELSEKANEGLLTDGEREELQVYSNIADLLAYWQLKARHPLHQNS